MDPSDALEIFALTDPGQVRSHNEDAVFANPGQGLVILADGMGGYNAGEVASGMTVTLLADSLGRQDLRCMSGAALEQLLRTEIQAVNQAIHQAADSQPQYAGMGTTLVMGVFHADRLLVGHVGDSRCYRWRQGNLACLTRDHSLLQEQIDSGLLSPAEARYSQNRNLVTRALGVESVVEVELTGYDVAVGDIYLFCSDGLNDMVEDEDIALTLQTLAANLPLAGGQLVQLANDNGGRDNVSVILVKVKASFKESGSWWRQWLAWLK
ncbi:Stp1/IreP family PP2C-type Ser/Thr phosphatase [Azovibrio restrictus]|uniref:Stp1/IreP family PP2C-type Ser/Thr phosphatase n=1 Tax=Azovibrio restrictus TaxID=146938 RepID=UPI0026EE893C|nr:Stp1/IreP family PP2C-type Ser/Thr phosphatase [Azovibrio restrictus]